MSRREYIPFQGLTLSPSLQGATDD